MGIACKVNIEFSKLVCRPYFLGRASRRDVLIPERFSVFIAEAHACVQRFRAIILIHEKYMLLFPSAQHLPVLQVLLPVGELSQCQDWKQVCFHLQIDADETFRTGETLQRNKNHVEMRDRLQEAYEALFLKTGRVDVGKMTFSNHTREYLYEAESILISDNKFDFE